MEAPNSFKRLQLVDYLGLDLVIAYKYLRSIEWDDAAAYRMFSWLWTSLRNFPGQSLQYVTPRGRAEKPPDRNDGLLAARWVSVMFLPAGFKSFMVRFVHLLPCWQGAVQSSAKMNGFFFCEAIAMVFLNMENSCISATDIQTCPMEENIEKIT